MLGLVNGSCVTLGKVPSLSLGRSLQTCQVKALSHLCGAVKCQAPEGDPSVAPSCQCHLRWDRVPPSPVKGHWVSWSSKGIFESAQDLVQSQGIQTRTKRATQGYH